MKKNLLLVLTAIIIASLGAFAQDSIPNANFTLLQTGKFVDASSEKESIIIPFDGMSAEEIYKMLFKNAALVVNNPDKQISGVEYSVVKVRAQQHLLTDVVMMLPLSCNGTMIYEFQIKEGRVKVNAPFVEEPCRYGTSDKICYFRSVVKGYFKKGKLKEKKAAEYNNLVNRTNNIINAILGLQDISEQVEEEDW